MVKEALTFAEMEVLTEEEAVSETCKMIPFCSDHVNYIMRDESEESDEDGE
jgi:transposase